MRGFALTLNEPSLAGGDGEIGFQGFTVEIYVSWSGHLRYIIK